MRVRTIADQLIRAGLTVLEAVLDRLDLEEINVSERAILHGVL